MDVASRATKQIPKHLTEFIAEDGEEYTLHLQKEIPGGNGAILLAFHLLGERRTAAQRVDGWFVAHIPLFYNIPQIAEGYIVPLDPNYISYWTDSDVRRIVSLALGQWLLYNESLLGDEERKDSLPQRKMSRESEPNTGSEGIQQPWEPPNEFAAHIMSKPDVTLRIGSNAESKEAFEILDAAGITCNIDRSNRRRIPSVTWGGLTFKGTEGMQELAEMFQDMDNDLDADIEANTEFFAPYVQPGVDVWAEKTRQRLSQEAREIVYEAPRGRQRKHSANG